MKKSILVMAAIALLSLGGIAQAITMDTVAVGNAGNAADTAAHSGNAAGQGSVGYNYNIGKYEVTTEQYTAFLNAVAATDTYALYNTSMWRSSFGCKIERTGDSGSYSYSVASDWANRPVNYVSWGDSARFANWLHNGQTSGAQGLSTTEDGAYYLNGATTDAQLMAVNRESDWKWAITSENEWYKAAYYDPNKDGTGIGGYWLYPTKSNIAPANQVKTTDPGNSANWYTNKNTIGSPYWRTNVGEFENSASAYGTFDQGGNVWEWNEAIISGTSRGQRGGFYLSPFSTLQSSSRISNNPYLESYTFGFRVSEVPGAVPEPGTILAALSILGPAGLIFRRRKA